MVFIEGCSCQGQSRVLELLLHIKPVPYAENLKTDEFEETLGSL
jgi:hypothetical protein